MKSGREALQGGHVCLQFVLFDHPDLQLDLDDFERTDIPGGGIEGRSVHCGEAPRREIEYMRSAAAQLGQQQMGSRGKLETHGDQRTVDFDADIARKLENKSRRAWLNVGTATNPCSAIRNDPAEPGHNHGLIFRQKCRQVEDVVWKRI
jgi:hypothetical protein